VCNLRWLFRLCCTFWCRRRAAHAARNLALTREMSRQQHAFLLAYQRDVAAGLKEQGMAVESAPCTTAVSINGFSRVACVLSEH
jgi:head-tail adaptor